MNYQGTFCVIALSVMTPRALDDFIDDCFVEKDPLCNLYKEEALWYDQYASDLIVGKQDKEKEVA